MESIEKVVYRYLKITELLLNPENPRFDAVKHQTEIIESMIEDQQEKLVELAKHISDFGLSPIDILLVRQHEKQWIVWEGNRRLTALKLMNEPELVPNKYSKIKREFQKLNAVLDSAMINNILCAVIEEKKIADEWIRLKHTGENKGIGTVSWDAQQTVRFSAQVRGVVDPTVVLFDFLRSSENLPLAYREHFLDIRKTNFDRLVKDPDVREFLKISSGEKGYMLEKGITPQLLLVLQDLIFTEFSVGSIYHKEDRRNYINLIKKRLEQEIAENAEPVSDKTNKDIIRQGDADIETADTPKNAAAPNDVHKKQGVASSGEAVATAEQGNTPAQGKTRSYPINRKTLVPSQHKLPISHARILKIFNELKALDCDSSPNAVAALFRVFIELSADCYIEVQKIKSVSCNSTLPQKIEAVANDMESKGIMTKYGLRTTRQMVSSQNQNTSVKTFHSYVHNKDVTPIPSDLRTAWDDLWPFIENLWR